MSSRGSKHKADVAPFDLESELKRLPGKPGVYRMYAKSGDLIYIGKAKSLKNRVRQYFQKATGTHTPKVRTMIRQIVRFDYIVTDSEIEALILESTLIKKHLPKFNILARDDKRYPWIGISLEPYPRVFVTRTPNTKKLSRQKKAKFFGPYTSARDMYLVLEVIKKNFPLRQRPRPLFKDRPCMNYYIGTCPGPCQELISEAEYAETVAQVELFLKGRADELLQRLKDQMEAASESLNFELAARLRDRCRAVENLVATQKVFYADDSISQDVVTVCGDELRFAFNLLSIRRGKLVASRSQEIQRTYDMTVEEAYHTFVYDHYDQVDADEIPNDVILQYPLRETGEEEQDEEQVFADWLTWRRKTECGVSRAVQVVHPEKGDKKALLAMSLQNAQEALEKAKLYDATRMRHDPMRALLSLQDILKLPMTPVRMECYDISHFQGAQTVASMVVFINGVPEKSEYRRFKIHSAEGSPDDFESMAEVIRRRMRHSSRGDDDTRWPDPDLMIIDGGKGQLGAACRALEAQGVRGQAIVSLAKKFEEVFVPGQSRPVVIPRDASALYLLQQIRDEAHRFAISYHRKLRGKAATRSGLDHIEGVGEKTRTALLAAFGSVAAMAACSVAQLAQAPGVTLRQAQAVYAALHPSQAVFQDEEDALSENKQPG